MYPLVHKNNPYISVMFHLSKAVQITVYTREASLYMSIYGNKINPPHFKSMKDFPHESSSKFKINLSNDA